MIHTKSCPHVFVAKGKNKKRKPSPDTGKVATIAVGRGKRE